VIDNSSKTDFLYGLDNLKWHWCTIDLFNNCLTFENGVASVPFLQPNEIAEEFKEDVEGETPMNIEQKVEELLKMGYE